MEKFYIMVDGQQDGPFTKQEIISKGFSNDSYIYNKNLGSWKKISEVLDLSSTNDEKPAIETTKTNTVQSNQFQSSAEGLSEGQTKNNFSNQAKSQVLNQASDNKKQNMFANPFSFDGRIRRMEYGISMIIQGVLLQIISEIVIETPAISILIIPIIWFGLSQSAKRCHDLGNSGWWQIIPFYGFWLLFQEGKPGSNEYGNNPKE